MDPAGSSISATWAASLPHSGRSAIRILPSRPVGRSPSVTQRPPGLPVPPHSRFTVVGLVSTFFDILPSLNPLKSASLIPFGFSLPSYFSISTASVSTSLNDLLLPEPPASFLTLLPLSLDPELPLMLNVLAKSLSVPELLII